MADSGAVDLTEFNGNALVVTAWSLLAFTYVSIVLRTYVRVALTHSFQADDWLMLVSQLIFTISCSFILVGVGQGIGFHDKALSRAREIEALKWQALATATYVMNMMFIKLSIAVFLLRLAVLRRYKWILWISMGVITIWSTVLFLWDIFQCSPVEAQWNTDLPKFQCVGADQVVNAAYALSVMTIISDWLYALLPVPMVWNVKMSTQAKISVMLVLGLGIFASVATLIRLKFLADLTDTDDILFAGTDAMVWTLIEPGVAIIASSLATIRPLLRKLRVKGFNSTNQSRTGYGRSGSKSQGLRSGTHKSAMPGFGAQDVTLVDIEAGHGAGANGKGSAPLGNSVYVTTTLSSTSRPAGTAKKGAGAKSSYRISEHRDAYLANADSDSDLSDISPAATSGVLVIEGEGTGSMSPTTLAATDGGMEGEGRWHSQTNLTGETQQTGAEGEQGERTGKGRPGTAL